MALRSLVAASSSSSSGSVKQAPVLSASGARVFWERAPRDVVLWPPSFEAFERLSTGLVPFVFVGVRNPATGVLSGILLVNADLADEQLWSKVQISIDPGHALATLGIAANVFKFSKFREVEVMAICIHGVQRGGGVVLEEACASELLGISPAWKKYQRVPCTIIQEVGISIQMVMSKHMSFVGSSFSRAAFVEFFVSILYENKPQDLVFVLKKPLARPMATLPKP